MLFWARLAQGSVRRSRMEWQGEGMDITYIPMTRGFVYLGAVVDWFSWRVCGATIWMRGVLPHSGMLPSEPGIASPKCSREHSLCQPAFGRNG
jgi:hypothetical protein